MDQPGFGVPPPTDLETELIVDHQKDRNAEDESGYQAENRPLDSSTASSWRVFRSFFSSDFIREILDRMSSIRSWSLPVRKSPRQPANPRPGATRSSGGVIPTSAAGPPESLELLLLSLGCRRSNRSRFRIATCSAVFASWKGLDGDVRHRPGRIPCAVLSVRFTRRTGHRPGSRAPRGYARP